LVQTYDAGSGRLRWSDQAPTFDIVASVRSAGFLKRAFVAGASPVPGLIGQTDALIRAYDVNTGDVVWYDFVDRGAEDSPTDIVAGRNAVVVAGATGFIRAYDPTTGALLWEDQVVGGGATLGILGNRVFVAGRTHPPGSPGTLLRAYDSANGQVLWSLEVPGAAASDLTASDGMVFLTAGGGDGFIAAFSALSGEPVWFDPGRSWIAAAADSGRVVAVGTDGASGLAMAAYQSRTGTILWEDATSPADPLAVEFLTNVDISNGVVYGGGQSGKAFSYVEVLVRAYDLGTGNVLFDDRSHRGGQSRALDIAAQGRRVVVAGTSVGPTGGLVDSDFLVRAFAAPAVPLCAPNSPCRRIPTW
jgi:quinoprotein glucose dehydrogenase